MKIFSLLLTIALVSSCSANGKDSSDESIRAIALVEQVCDGDNKLSWEERVALAAQASYLDKRWERLADASYSRVGYDEILELDKNNNLSKNYPTLFLERFYESRFQYAKFAAEFSILEPMENEDK